MLSTVIVVLLVVIFVCTFIIPIALKNKEGFQTFTGGGYKNYMGNYLSERKGMIESGNRQYNGLGASLDPILPTFAVAPSGIEDNTTLTIPQYLQQFNQLTNSANKILTNSLANPDIAPTTASPTNMGPKPMGIKAQLPPPNDLLVKARQCENDLKTRDSCSKLDDPTYESCGICIDGGTKFNGDSAQTFIGGLLSLVSERNEAASDAAGGTPVYQPTIGKCPPGMFYVDSASCKKAVNQLNCSEIGSTGGFEGGKTKEGRKIPDVSCAQAPIQDMYVYQPPNDIYDVTLRFLSPFGTGITKAIVTHKPVVAVVKDPKTGQNIERRTRTFTANNDGKPGVEFTLTLQGVMEQDPVVVEIVQEMPHRSSGKPEVFYVYEKNSQGGIKTCDKANAQNICSRIGTSLATKDNVKKSNDAGGQAPLCGMISDSDTPMFSVQSGYAGFVGIGSHPKADFCPASNPSYGAWCYGFKPKMTATVGLIPTFIYQFFDSFGTNAQPAQGNSLYSEYSDSVSNNPPGISQRGVIIQWEMVGSENRTVPFMQTITKVGANDLKLTPSALRLLGPYAKSSLIRGPAWNSKSSMVKNQFWFWNNTSAASQSAIFTAHVPGYLENPYYEDDLQNTPIGPLITNPKTMELLKTSPCFAEGQEPGLYSAACLLNLFQGNGGDPSKGTLATENGGLSQLNKYGDISDISDYLAGLYITALSGKDINGNVISLDMTTRIAAMNDAAMKLFGFKITNPCEDLVDNADGSVGLVAKPMTNVTADCLQYLWLNNLSDQDRSPYGAKSGGIFDGTYTSVADRFSGLRYNESTPKRRSQYPFQACQLGGTMAPVKNGEPDRMVIGRLTSMDSLQAVQNFFNGIQKAANYSQDQKAQAAAMEQCYGIKQAKNKSLGYGCTLIMPQNVIPGVTCYVNLGDPTEITNYLMYSSGAAFFGGVQNSPNITFMLTAPNTGQANCVSFKTTDSSPLFLRHSGFRIYAHRNDGSTIFAQDSTWKIVSSLNKDPTMISLQSVNYPDQYFSQAGAANEVWLTKFANTAEDANRKSFTIIGVPAVPQPLPPSLPVMDGLVLWLDAKDSSTVGVNGSSVTQWKDKSGSGNDMTKISGSVTYTPDSGLTFQAGGILQTAGKISISPGSHVFVVTQVTSITSTGLGYVFGLTDMHGPGDYSIRFMTPTSLAQWDANDMGQPLYYVNGTASRYAGTVAVPPGVNTICGVASEGGSTRLSLSTAFMNRFLIGTISEVLVFEQNLSDTQRKSVEGYLACKWGLQSKLPQAHPYATTCAKGGTQSGNGCIVPDTVPKGTFSGDWIPGSPTATAVNVDDQCNKVAMFHSPDNFTKMVSDKGVAKYYTGQTNLYNPASWPTYKSAQGHYAFNGF